MIKGIWAVNRLPGFSDEEFYNWWYTEHGLEQYGLLPYLRYVQVHTIPATRDGRYGLTPTRDGASMIWFDSFAGMRELYASIDRSSWAPGRFAPQMDVVIGEEHVIIDGETSPAMVKLIVIGRRNPELTSEEFRTRWLEVQAPHWTRIPGIRRYVQNHALPEAYETAYDPNHPNRMQTHDGWSEVWFDDLESMKRAVASPEAQEARQHRHVVFDAPSMSIIIGRELEIAPRTP